MFSIFKSALPIVVRERFLDLIQDCTYPEVIVAAATRQTDGSAVSRRRRPSLSRSVSSLSLSLLRVTAAVNPNRRRPELLRLPDPYQRETRGVILEW
ncbi:hypothetical protein Hanom_Chr11g01053371 [Helianthus anomalus]